ncbi:MAG: radical SAM/CxCxxxxC motif protein YfkAB [Paenibacillaceae bacterium ZCTH02-B3]|nr:MAG: radical SAM/CxCxxxxC motif protein YfkAB [Paenibacillaceae bacterium ZCTH02-B3]
MQPLSRTRTDAPFAPPPELRPITPEYDPWDPILSLQKYGRHVLTSVELTVTHLCNLRCEHCAVGDTLTTREAPRLPVDLVLRRLDEVEHLETISLTGGEPTFSRETIDQVILPVLKYARARGVRTQLNSNVTLDYERYAAIAPHLDVMHISFNYTGPEDFRRITFARSGKTAGGETAARIYERMMDNARRLAEGGLFVSAESMINYRTWRNMAQIHRLVVEMGCRRHEVHPMYPSAFAADLPLLPRDKIRSVIFDLLEARDPNVWMLFGTLPFFACSDDPEDLRLIARLRAAPNVTVRNDPDGRCRVNVNLFTGNVYVTDFAKLPPIGNIREEKLDDMFARWQAHPLQRAVGCHCPEAGCCGPNLLVTDMYYRGVDFTRRRAKRA